MAENITQHTEQESNNQVQRIWAVFWILSAITLVEVVLGILRPAVLDDHRLWNMKLINWIFVGLTVVKAYYITWTFMHMEQETAGLRRSVVWTIVFYISYLIFIILVEGDYHFDMTHNEFMAWDF